VWLCYGYLRGVVMSWLFKGLNMLWVFYVCVYGIEGMWLCYGYLRGVVMLWVFKGCGYVMGI
jgi:hypothetical protein